MRIPDTLLRTPCVITPTHGTAEGTVDGQPVDAMCSVRITRRTGQAGPYTVAVIWFPAYTPVEAGNRVEVSGRRFTVSEVTTHNGPMGVPAAVEVQAS